VSKAEAAVTTQAAGLPPRSAEADAAEGDSPQRRYVQRLLARALRQPVAVVALRREPIPVASLFPAEVLTVVLADGSELALFVKHLGREQADHPDKQRRDREVRVYEELLGDPALPVPRYYGSRWNAATRRREMYLEHVPDWSLKYTDLEHWFTAARRLAQLQAHFAARAEELLGRDFLLRLDAGYFQAWAERARAAVARHCPEIASDLGRAVGGYERVAALLAGQPITLVHNDLAPKNVVADRSRSPARICVVDWEMAGAGCGLLDLVHLKHGLDRPDDERMRAVYCAELVGTGLLPTDAGELERLLAACELHQTMCRLTYFARWRVPRERVVEWVREAKRLAEGI
jgi:aminoglycoside phosphotransferase (APT) family kinase protein